MSEWKRARNDEQIEERVSAILEAAGRVFRKRSYDEVTMMMIAEEAGFTRSNLYRYFKTREEIFLSLFILDAENWTRDVTAAFSEEMDLEGFVVRWTQVLTRQKRLLELSSLLAISLEKNTSEEVYKKTKIVLNQHLEQLISAIQVALPSLKPQEAMSFMATTQVLIAGAWPMGQHSKIQEKVLKELKMPHMKFDFIQYFKSTILIYLKGLGIR